MTCKKLKTLNVVVVAVVEKTLSKNKLFWLQTDLNIFAFQENRCNILANIFIKYFH